MNGGVVAQFTGCVRRRGRPDGFNHAEHFSAIMGVLGNGGVVIDLPFRQILIIQCRQLWLCQICVVEGRMLICAENRR